MLKVISEQEYNYFRIENNQTHFLNSPKWAEFRKSVNWDYEIIGYYNDNKLEIATLIMYKNVSKLPYKIAYTPRGYIVNNNKNESEFIGELKKYLKKKKVISYKIDPDQVYQHLDKNLQSISEPQDTIVANYKKLGFKHLGFVNNFEGMQPRHTIRIDTKQTYDEFTKNLEKKTRNATKVGKKQGLKTEVTNKKDLDIFMNLLKETSERDGFGIRDKSYFEKLFDTFGEDVELRLAKIEAREVIEKLKKEKNEIKKELEKTELKLNKENIKEKLKQKFQNKIDEYNVRIEKIEKMLIKLDSVNKKYSDGLYIAGSLYITDNDKTWYIYGATSNKFRETMPAYMLVDSMVGEAIESQKEFFDLFGIGGDYDPENHNFGLFTFKRGFGGDIIEFVGEFDLPINKLMFTVFEKGYPMLKKIKKKI